jgi:flagellar basal-body rod modification protein FlgD
MTLTVTTLPHTAPTAALAQGPSNGLSENYQSFLKLLVAQVSYQDPLNPVEGTDFIAQLATLTGVEQSLKLNEQMEALRAQLGLSAALSESSLIGRTVTIPSDVIELGEGGASFGYELGSGADSVTAIISDASGNPVRRLEGLPGAAGERYSLTWDGTDANGAPLPPGRYQIALAATDVAGGYNTYASFRVVSVSFDAGRQWLDLEGGGSVTSEQIIRID